MKNTVVNLGGYSVEEIKELLLKLIESSNGSALQLNFNNASLGVKMDTTNLPVLVEKEVTSQAIMVVDTEKPRYPTKHKPFNGLSQWVRHYIREPGVQIHLGKITKDAKIKYPKLKVENMRQCLKYRLGFEEIEPGIFLSNSKVLLKKRVS